MEEPPTPQGPNPHPPATPVMDVVAPPPTTSSAETKDAPKLTPTPQKPAPAKPSQPKKAAGESVNTAIAATVVIVLGLALLAVYAYLAQKR